MTPNELKNSILQLAIHGKLVEQRPEEGTGEELYQQIQKEKQALIKAGKIKKGKPLPEIAEDEVPFEIPDSWKWVHLNQIAESSLGKTLDKAKNTGELCQYLCSVNVYWNGISLEKIKEAKFSEDDKIKYRLKRGDMLICEGGDVGRTAIWDSDDEMYYQNALHRVRFYGEILPYYFKYVIECYKGIGIIDEFSKGMTIKHLVQNSLYAMYLPLPPLAEQKRIVAKIEELLPLIDRYEQAWTRLEDFNKRFPVDMQKSILQMAIQGKLVEQRPEEGTGEELYQQIQREKQALIQAGKLKKQKPLPEIAEDEVPFEIPETWKWCHVGELFDHNTGKAMNASAKKSNKPGSIRQFITTSNLYWNTFDFASVKEMFFSDDELERCTATKGDILMCEGGAYFGRTAIWNYAYDICIQNHIHRLRAFLPLNNMFFYHVFWLYRTVGLMQSKGTAMPGLSSVALHNLRIPLPPLAEQKRIVARLEELLPLCEGLK